MHTNDRRDGNRLTFSMRSEHQVEMLNSLQPAHEVVRFNLLKWSEIIISMTCSHFS